MAAVTYGDAVIGTTHTDLRTAHSLLPEFEAKLDGKQLSVEEFAKRLSGFFMKQWQERRMPPANVHPGSGMTFAVAGFDPGAPYGRVFLINIPKDPTPREQAPNDFGITFGGQGECAARLLMGYDAQLPGMLEGALRLNPSQVQIMRAALQQLHADIPWGILPLQDCIDLAIYLVKTTIASQNLSLGLRGVGGPIDVAVITPQDGVQIVQRKRLAGETSSQA